MGDLDLESALIPLYADDSTHRTEPDTSDFSYREGAEGPHGARPRRASGGCAGSRDPVATGSAPPTLEALASPEVAVGAIVAVATHCAAVLALVDTLSMGASGTVACFSLTTHMFYFG